MVDWFQQKIGQAGLRSVMPQPYYPGRSRPVPLDDGPVIIPRQQQIQRTQSSHIATTRSMHKNVDSRLPIPFFRAVSLNTNPERRFATTSWSLVLQARGDESGDQHAALEHLCESYWYPLYAYLRRCGNDTERAADLTQAFFTELLEKQVLEAADHRRGRFRSFLLAALNHFVSNQIRIDNALKRGGGKSLVSLQPEMAERRYQGEPAIQDSPDRHYLRQWAIQILELAADSLKRQYIETGKDRLFQSLCQYLTPGGEVPYREVAAELGLQEGAVKVAVHRLRQRYGQEIRLQIAQTVDDPADVEDELQQLFDALAAN